MKKTTILFLLTGFILSQYVLAQSNGDTRLGTDGTIETHANARHGIFNNKSLVFSRSIEPSWEFIGPHENLVLNKPNNLGLVACLATDPNNKNVLYAGAITGGLWKTTNPTALSRELITASFLLHLTNLMHACIFGCIDPLRK